MKETNDTSHHRCHYLTQSTILAQKKVERRIFWRDWSERIWIRNSVHIMLGSRKQQLATGDDVCQVLSDVRDIPLPTAQPFTYLNACYLSVFLTVHSPLLRHVVPHLQHTTSSESIRSSDQSCKCLHLTNYTKLERASGANLAGRQHISVPSPGNLRSLGSI